MKTERRAFLLLYQDPAVVKFQIQTRSFYISVLEEKPSDTDFFASENPDVQVDPPSEPSTFLCCIDGSTVAAAALSNEAVAGAVNSVFCFWAVGGRGAGAAARQ